MAAQNSVEDGKKRAAYAAVDDNVRSGMVVGIGSGSTIVYAVNRIQELVEQKKLTLVGCVPTSFQSIDLIETAGLPLSDLRHHPTLDVALDGADEVDAHLNCIKGGGGCQLQEKVVASAAKLFVVMADYRKDSSKLGEKWQSGVPIEVLPLAYKVVQRKLEKIGGKAALRMDGKSKAGPTVTDNGNFILDTDFGVIENPRSLETQLCSVPGIIETGLFIEMANKVYFGNAVRIYLYPTNILQWKYCLPD